MLLLDIIAPQPYIGYKQYIEIVSSIRNLEVLKLFYRSENFLMGSSESHPIY